MGIIGDAVNAFRFKDTIFYKETCDLKYKLYALNILKNEYPNNKEIISEYNIVKKGLEGEDEIAYQLKKCNIGMYVLRDVKLRYEDLTAQIDFIVITPVFIYYIECKNLVGNITVNEQGDFIREYNYDGKSIKKGMYSPLRQVEAQREVVRKIWDNKTTKLSKIFGSKNFNKYRKVLVVAANKDTILNIDKSPKDIKNKIIRSDALIRRIENDLNNIDKGEVFDSKKEMEEIAKSYINLSYIDNIDYLSYYRDKYCNDDLKERLIELRKKRSSEMNIPAYYVFNNDEMDKLLKLRPKNIEELKKSNILNDIKIKTHGNKIIEEINKK